MCLISVSVAFSFTVLTLQQYIFRGDMLERMLQYGAGTVH